MPLALQEVADRVTGKAGLQGGSETRVSCERIGTKVTSAVDRPGPSNLYVAVTLDREATCWTASSISLSVGPGPHKVYSLLPADKNVGWGE